MTVISNGSSSLPDSIFQKKKLTGLKIIWEEYTLFQPSIAFGPDSSKANQLKELPERIGELTELDTLIVNCTGIKTLPKSIVKLQQLKLLDLAMNANIDAAAELDKLKQLPQLKKLIIFGTGTSGFGYREITNELKNVQVLITADEYEGNKARANKQNPANRSTTNQSTDQPTSRNQADGCAPPSSFAPCFLQETGKMNIEGVFF